jgi:hypothetical protein
MMLEESSTNLMDRCFSTDASGPETVLRMLTLLHDCLSADKGDIETPSNPDHKSKAQSKVRPFFMRTRLTSCTRFGKYRHFQAYREHIEFRGVWVGRCLEGKAMRCSDIHCLVLQSQFGNRAKISRQDSRVSSVRLYRYTEGCHEHFGVDD